MHIFQSHQRLLSTTVLNSTQPLPSTDLEGCDLSPALVNSTHCFDSNSVAICQLLCNRVIGSVIFQPCFFSLCSFLVRHYRSCKFGPPNPSPFTSEFPLRLSVVALCTADFCRLLYCWMLFSTIAVVAGEELVFWTVQLTIMPMHEFDVNGSMHRPYTFARVPMPA